MANFKNNKPKSFKGCCGMCCLRTTDGRRNGRRPTLQEYRAGISAQEYEMLDAAKKPERDDDDEGVWFSEARCLRANGDSLYCDLGRGKARWVPRAALHNDTEVLDVGDHGDLVVASWWAENEGIV